MMLSLSAVTYLVRDYDEAIAWFIGKLGFVVVEDTRMSDSKRWVKVAAGQGGTCLLLAKADGPVQDGAVGMAAGGRVAYFLYTDDFAKTHARLLTSGVAFREIPRHEAYGTVAVFEDLYGNGWDLIQPK
jgi:catechol 2,3-dioxygenase-like lactoylglutathione lyase family enzyme